MPATSSGVDQALQRLVTDRVATRLKRKDASLWPAESPGAEPAAEIMGWLELPATLQGVSGQINTVTRDLASRGITDVVVLGMGGSSMTPEVLRVIFGTQPGGMRLHVLDTVNPDTIGPVTRDLPLPTTAFAVCSKSGTTVEPLSLEKHFRSALEAAGIEDTAAHFIAITDAGTPLAKRAEAGELSGWLETPRDVGGRFSALTSFGMFGAGALGVSLDRIISSASAMAVSCLPDAADNPGLRLGALLGSSAVGGRNKVTLLTSPGLERFGLWVEQLLAESTGKGGKGLVPVAGEPLLSPGEYSADRVFVHMRLGPADNSRGDSLAGALESAGHPVYEMPLGDLHDLGGLFYQWEFATAVAGHIMELFPFDQPDVNAAKDAARAILASGELPSDDSETDLDSAVKSLVESPGQGDYVAIGAFMPESDAASAAWAGLRARITKRTGMPTTFGYGPRYLHSTGQLYKGGPGNVRFLGAVSHGSGDIKVPGESYTLGALTPAQAHGDFEVMRERGRRIKTAGLGSNSVDEIDNALRD